MRNKLAYLFLFLLFPLFAFSQQRITEAEYFIDTDPGQGLATPMLALDGSFTDVLETAIKSNVGSWTLGAHKIGVRIKDNNGNWGPVFQTVLMVQSPAVIPAINLTAGECFWNNDPGQGNGTPMLSFDGTFNDAMEAVVKSNFAHPGLGMHKLSVRVKDVNNNWSAVFSTVVSVQNPFVIPQIKLTAAECFWDADPGQGSGTVMLAFDGLYSDALESVVKSNLANPGLGMHKLSVRTKDANNNWGPVFSTVVSIQNPFVIPAIKIVAAECFWDTDPGQGNGTAMLAFDGNFTDAMESVAKSNFANPGLGMHKLSVRVKDVNNNWSPVFSTVVSVQSPYIFPVLQITAAELFWDTDPGQGNATPMLAFDGNFNDAYETAIKNEPAYFLSQGLHILNVRMCDPNTTWSPVFRTVVYLDACISTPSVTVTAGGPTTFCAGDSVLLTATAGFSTYYWRRNGVPVGGNTSSIYATQSGNYIVTVIDANGCPGTSAIISLNVSTPVAVITGALSFCQGDSTLLDAGAGYASYTWSTGDTTQQIYASTAATFTVVVSTASGCIDTSGPVSTTILPLPPVPTITQNIAVLTSSSATGNQWYLNGNIIPGATGQNYTVTQNGNYTVVVTDANGCSATSAIYVFLSTTVQPVLLNTSAATVFPNPFNETGTLVIHATGVNGNVAVEIFNLVGQTLVKEEVELNSGSASIMLNRTTFSAGTYLYAVMLKDGTKLTGKFIVQ